MDTRDHILEGVIRVFHQKGIKFTMDDLAAELGMSKKTIYTVFRDKESLFYAMVDYCFDRIKESEAAVVRDASLSTAEKIRRIMIALPDSYMDVDFRQLYVLKEKYPKIYRKVEERLETGWESTFALLEQGMAEGVIRPINITILKTMFEATLEQFFQRDILISGKIGYVEALNSMMDILMEGILVRPGSEKKDG